MSISDIEQELIIALESFRVHLPMRLRGLATKVIDQIITEFERKKKMKASELIKALQHIIDTEGDLEVDISVAKQPNAKLPDQQYLVASPRFIELEKYEDPNETRISIRDWPY